VLDDKQAGLVCGECAGVHRAGLSLATRNISWDTIGIEHAAVRRGAASPRRTASGRPWARKRLSATPRRLSAPQRVAAAVATGDSAAYSSHAEGRATAACGGALRPDSARQHRSLFLAVKYASVDARSAAETDSVINPLRLPVAAGASGAGAAAAAVPPSPRSPGPASAPGAVDDDTEPCSPRSVVSDAGTPRVAPGGPVVIQGWVRKRPTSGASGSLQRRWAVLRAPAGGDGGVPSIAYWSRQDTSVAPRRPARAVHGAAAACAVAVPAGVGTAAPPMPGFTVGMDSADGAAAGAGRRARVLLAAFADDDAAGTRRGDGAELGLAGAAAVRDAWVSALRAAAAGVRPVLGLAPARGVVFVTVEEARDLANLDSGVMGDVTDPRVLLWMGQPTWAEGSGPLPVPDGRLVHATPGKTNTLSPGWGPGPGGGGPFPFKWDGASTLRVLVLDVDVLTTNDVAGEAAVRLDGIPDYAPLSREEEDGATAQSVWVPVGRRGRASKGMVRISMRYHGLGEAW